LSGGLLKLIDDYEEKVGSRTMAARGTNDATNARRNGTPETYKSAKDSSPSFPVGARQEGVGLRSPSTFVVSNVLPSWWVRLVAGGGLVGFLVGGGVGVGYIADVRLSYPELVQRLDGFGYRYVLDRRWRSKLPKDWRRRSGVIAVNVVRGVVAFIKVDCGYAVVVQLVGSVRDPAALNRVVDFLRDVFGLSVDVEDLVSSPAAPRPDPNTLKRISWGVIRRASDDWLPITEFSRHVAERLVVELEDNAWIDVVSAPRVGKSSGVIYGIMRWIIENNIDGYVVLIVVVNKNVGRQLYRYALGAWRRLLKDLQDLGWNAGMLAEKIRIRYYEGMESSCLMNKEVHKFDECLKCSLFQLYHKDWRKVYRFPVPVMDPVVLRMSGYCSFQVLFSPTFWRNSVVIVNYRLLPLVSSILERLRLRWVVVYFDEYLIQLMHRIALYKLDPKWYSRLLDLDVEFDGKRVRFRDVINKWNAFIDKLYAEIWKSYEKLGYEIFEEAMRNHVRDPFYIHTAFMTFFGRVVRGDVDLSDIIGKVKDDYWYLIDVLDKFYEKYRLPVFRRMRRYLEYVVLSFTRVEFDGSDYREVFAPELGRDGIYSTPGGFVNSFVFKLLKLREGRGVKVAVVTSSVDDADVGGANGFVYELRMVAPGAGFKYKRISMEYGRSVIMYETYPYTKDFDYKYVDSLRVLYWELKDMKLNVAVVVDRDSMLTLASWFEKEGYEVKYARDPEKSTIVDYVVVKKPGGRIVLMFHPHGRIAVGVDPPHRDEIEAVIVALGVRSRPRHFVPIPSVLRDIALAFQGRPISSEGLEGVYGVVWNGLLFVYDVFSRKYDIHMLVQVVGRFFLSRSMMFLFLNRRFAISNLRFFILIHYFESEAVKLRAGRVWRVRYYHIVSKKIYDSDYDVKTSGDSVLNIRSWLEPVNIREFVDRNVRYYLVDLFKVQRGMYIMLKSVYNSLRYCRTQLKYGRQPDRWWLLKKLVYLVNGFACARRSKSAVPLGLRRAYEKYVIEGVVGMLEYIKDRYLQGIDPEVWAFVRSRILGFTRRMWMLF